ncbi:hypothetical protein [Hyphomonas sp.]|uniref:hypothetical protein n=1 Tax=Hyphomonas sp. TaxID=87 RepID=UPI0030027DF8
MPRGGKREGAGRKKGSVAPATKLLKDAILEAAAAVGSDDKGKGKLVGYLTERAKDQPVAFMSMLGRVMPMQVTGPEDDEGNYQEIRVSFVGSGSNPS